ncbi:DUF3069 domain-containing protein [Shewanella gelidii]|uniref:DUF3069 domain-containing protein n=1 Tax=Shewanella gelidii TaxID=1642821 RepID=A0A917JJ56_9GAMM|nr:DUF3069 domain-containing protein [Shewanella gelidii]MCL1096779.1 DUF3069 domain-containing protein [Shewanella gelidii]GGI70095.1 hypothetical protein GCM10009332_04160 [Shewanella gelidii]
MNTEQAEYKLRAEKVALNVTSMVLPMDSLPESLVEAYANLFEELLADEEQKFEKVWTSLPASATKLVEKVDFHGFYIANAWLQLSRVAQDIAELADSDDAIQEHEYNDIFTRLAETSLKESAKKLKKARTDRVLLNSMLDVIHRD